ncbi:MAG: hypothetical protein AB1586_10210 [Pseudomonadota bacterium]
MTSRNHMQHDAGRVAFAAAPVAAVSVRVLALSLLGLLLLSGP